VRFRRFASLGPWAWGLKYRSRESGNDGLRYVLDFLRQPDQRHGRLLRVDLLHPSPGVDEREDVVPEGQHWCRFHPQLLLAIQQRERVRSEWFISA
jgi:hypothetical protein